MAAISSTKRTTCHARSISLPSTLDPPTPFNKKFHSFQETPASCSSSSSSIDLKLKGLNSMYESVEMFLTLPTTQQSIAQGCSQEQVNKLFDELLELLDLCSTTKDALSMLMDLGKQLQSVLRRKRGDNNELISSVEDYLSRRKNVKVVARKAISHLKKQGSLLIKEGERTASSVDVLKELESDTLVVFESLLTFILGSNSQSRSLVSKILGYKHMQGDQTIIKTEVTKVDDELLSLISQKGRNLGRLDVEIIPKRLTEMEFSLVHLHEQVECIFRHLIKTRVSFLNIFNC